jgi:1-acyl-sn-glycerol-3-phosphate acyltransferase
MSGVWAGASRDRYLRWNFALQRWWAGSLFAAGQRIFGLNTEVEMPPDLDRGPFIIFIRHTSIADTLLPATFLSRRYGLRLRYVLKSELIWDPCLDIVGHRLPNCFVKRGAGDSLAVASVQRLMNGLAAGDGVLMYPEGTRFTEDKKRRALDSLSRSADPRLVEKARGFRNVLPPRLGGPLALLERNKSADVLFCAHVGFEGVTNFRDLMRGSMVGALIHVKFWRVPFDEIPDERQSMTNWLFDQWKMVDDWVTEHRAPIQPGR